MAPLRLRRWIDQQLTSTGHTSSSTFIRKGTEFLDSSIANTASCRAQREGKRPKRPGRALSRMLSSPAPRLRANDASSHPITLTPLFPLIADSFARTRTSANLWNRNAHAPGVQTATRVLPAWDSVGTFFRKSRSKIADALTRYAASTSIILPYT